MKGHTHKWNQLETMFYDTPEKTKAPYSTKASTSKVPSTRAYSGSGGRTFKFVRASNEYGIPQSLNMVRDTSSPSKVVIRDESADCSIDNSKERANPHIVVG